VYTLVAVILPSLLPVFQLEKPTGSYAVGTTTYSWSESTNTSTGGNAAKSDLVVHFWYPAERTGTSQTAPYVTPEMLQQASEETGTPAWLLNSVLLVQTDAQVNAPVAKAQSTYPVILFVPGEVDFIQIFQAM
jgi:predicted dienelactone hydrolase